MLQERGREPTRGQTACPRGQVGNWKDADAEEALAILNSNEKETRNLSPGGICKSRQPPEWLPTSAFGPKGESDTGKQAWGGAGC